MDRSIRQELEEKILAAVRQLQNAPDDWVDFATLGTALSVSGISYKDYGYLKLRPFLTDFDSVLEFDSYCEDGKTPVFYARPKDDQFVENERSDDDADISPNHTADHWEAVRVPTPDTWLFRWVFISPAQIERLANLALPEKWYYGEEQDEADQFPILRNYLQYTFKKLCTENKIYFETDLIRGEEYAAFNTGLVDQKYEYIYALCKKNTRGYGLYWYLVDFVVAGEDAGKTLVSLFNPMPKKADYFNGRIENMLYDTSTGDLACDYVHILTERAYRLPIDFFEENCPTSFTDIDGVGIDDIAVLPENSSERKDYFRKLGEKIQHTPKILNRLKNRLDDAVKLALKRVEWNYKTAIPIYFPSRDTMSLLLPLALVDEDRIDLALVVDRKQSGAYQGQTVLPLAMAYSNSRLVARPDSDWLKTDMISSDADASVDD
jgi:hypothetical protein